MPFIFFILSMMESFFLKIILMVHKLVPNAKIKERIEFELKNLEKINILQSQKHSCFFVSSEGELEIIFPLIETFLVENKDIKILYTSPSVEHRILKLEDKYQQLISTLRLPLLTRNFNQQIDLLRWLENCPEIYFVRYEFYPSILYFCLSNNIILKLIGANYPNTFYKKICLKLFNKILFSLEKDLIRYNQDSKQINAKSFDFRLNQIYKRVIQNRFESKNNVQNENLKKIFSKFEYEKSIIFGSIYVHDFKFIDDILLNTDFKIAIFPHDLNEDNILNIKDKFKNYSLYEINDTCLNNERLGQVSSEQNRLYLFNLKGILCESYQFFKHAYVGGGIHNNIHSVLEPYIANNYIYCGPNINKSTEYTFINSIDPKSIKVISIEDNLKDCLINKINRKFDIKLINKFDYYKNWIKA